MKKMIFLVILSLSLQGFSQVKSGVYRISEALNFEWDNGNPDGDVYSYDGPMFIHITETGFRVYLKRGDVGMSYPLVFIGKSSDGYYTYAVPFGDKFEIKNDVAVLFYDFNN